MSRTVQMVDAAREAMLHVLHLNPHERVLIVTDQDCRAIGHAFVDGAKEIGTSTELYFLRDAKRPLKEPTAEMLDLLRESDVVINAFIAINEEIPFRIKWIKGVIGDGKRRLGHAPGITEEMMTEGPLNVDYQEMVGTARAMLDALKGARTVHISSLAGTDITLDVEGRDFVTDVLITAGKMGNLPAGEVFCAPVEDGANGVIVIDGVIGNVGPVAEPVMLTVKEGRLSKVACGNADLEKKIKKFCAVDEMAAVIGELGIGINPRARLTGNLLEDEKAYRTVHIAFGNNEEMPGGKNTSQVHRDYLFHTPTVTVTYFDDSRRELLKDGAIQV